MKKSDKKFILNIISEIIIAYRPDFAKCFGGVQAGLFLSQLFYWSGKGKTDWIYKTQKEWHDELGMTRREQETARNKLKEMNVIDEKLRKVPATVHYRINFDVFIVLLQEFYQNRDFPDPHIRQTGSTDQPIQIHKSAKPPITENTAKSTAENTVQKTDKQVLTNNSNRSKTKVDTFVPCTNTESTKGSEGQSIIEKMRGKVENVEVPYSKSGNTPDGYIDSGQKEKKTKDKRSKTFILITDTIIKIVPEVAKFMILNKETNAAKKAIKRIEDSGVDPKKYTEWFLKKGNVFKGWGWFTAEGFLLDYASDKNLFKSSKKEETKEEKKARIKKELAEKRKKKNGN